MRQEYKGLREAERGGKRETETDRQSERGEKRRGMTRKRPTKNNTVLAKGKLDLKMYDFESETFLDD